LKAIGLPVAMYHGRLGGRERGDNQERFRAGDLKAMVATNAFDACSSTRQRIGEVIGISSAAAISA
jgi:superfamily II DNA/RNA helicase